MVDSPLTLRERLEHRVARALLRLPPSVLVRLSGKPQVVRDGLALHPEVQFLLSLRERLGRVALSSLSPQEGRRRMRREALVHAGELIEVGEVLYPSVDRTVVRASMERFAEGFFLTRADISLCRELSNLPPALVITAGFDPLRDEGEEYASALQKAGTPATLRCFDGLVHGFANMAGVSPACREAMVEIASTLRRLLDQAPARMERSRLSA